MRELRLGFYLLLFYFFWSITGKRNGDGGEDRKIARDIKRRDRVEGRVGYLFLFSYGFALYKYS